MKTEQVTYYIAKDGAKFTDENICKHYEDMLAVDSETELSDLILTDLKYKQPLLASQNDKLGVSLSYEWYYLRDEEAFNRLKNFFNRHKKLNHLRPPKDYPELIAIELSRPYKLYTDKNETYTNRYEYYHETVARMTEYMTDINKILLEERSKG